MRYFVSGGCGFIGSHMVDRLINRGQVVVYDNLSSGQKEFIKHHLKKDNFKFIEADLLDFKTLKKALKNCDMVFHMAANPDIKNGVEFPELDFEQGVLVTHNILEAMRLTSVKKIVFASSSAVFGEVAVRPTPEDYGPSMPISIYGASKLACEGFISAYCHMFDMRAWIFRFANIVGKRATHGILLDFINKLKRNKKELEILGDGNQRKSYLLVEDCADGMLFAVDNAKGRLNIFNLGTDDDIEVSRIAEILVKKLKIGNVHFRYKGGKCGWRGDVPLMLLDTAKMKKLGWNVKYGSKKAVEKAIGGLIEQGI